MSQVVMVAVLPGFGIAAVVGLFLFNRSNALGSGKRIQHRRFHC